MSPLFDSTRTEERTPYEVEAAAAAARLDPSPATVKGTPRRSRAISRRLPATACCRAPWWTSPVAI